MSHLSRLTRKLEEGFANESRIPNLSFKFSFFVGPRTLLIMVTTGRETVGYSLMITHSSYVLYCVLYIILERGHQLEERTVSTHFVMLFFQKFSLEDFLSIFSVAADYGLFGTHVSADFMETTAFLVVWDLSMMYKEAQSTVI